ncbi:MAG TPA: hypothetical protein VJ417_09490, partial [Candidatus Glassbacteria bacterium]|nr:hypothetical protein [Candidatus Glassbacteria bacterium]
MSWKSLAEIDSVSLDDLNEYMSRPDERVLELVGQRLDSDIVIYGATGKWTMDITEMLLRAVQQNGTGGRRLHLVARFSNMERVEKRLKPYKGLYCLHRVDFLNLMMSDLIEIEADTSWVLYGIGYKFHTHETEKEYERLCNLYGKVIPSLIFTYHRKDSEIVMIGSGNALPPSPVDRQAPDDAPLVPLPQQIYGESIRNKEELLKLILEGAGQDSSRAVILRAMYITNLTYGGLEKPMLAVYRGQPVDLSQAGVFNIVSHRDASIYAILAVSAASNPVTTLNLSGHTVASRTVAEAAAEVIGGAA